MKKICFMFGHRDAPQEISSALEAAVEEQYYKFGVRSFIVGHRGAFDTMAASAVKNLKKRYADVCLQMLIAYHPAQRKINVPEGFDGTYYPDGMERIPPRFCICAANRKLVSLADTVICYVKYVGNTKDLLRIVIGRNIPICNLATAWMLANSDLSLSSILLRTNGSL